MAGVPRRTLLRRPNIFGAPRIVGHAWALYNLGHLYLDGRGVERDLTRAYRHYRRAADLEHERAMNLVGRCTEEGWGTARDLHCGRRLVPALGGGRLFPRSVQLGRLVAERGALDESAMWFERAAAGGTAAIRRSVRNRIVLRRTSSSGKSRRTPQGRSFRRSRCGRHCADEFIGAGVTMFLRIPEILNDEQLATVRAALESENAPWVDGRLTAGYQGARVKSNQQLDEASPMAHELGNFVLAQLERNALFISAVLPFKVYPPMFNRYGQGMHFGTHVDGPSA